MVAAFLERRPPVVLNGYVVRVIDLPTPTDVLSSTLLWLGVPALVLLPITLALWVADWISTARRVGRGAGSALRRGEQVWQGQKVRPAIRGAGWLLLQGTLTAVIYSSFRLARAMSIPDANGRNIADGKSFTWSELWLNLTVYSAEDPIALKAFWITVGWMLAYTFAQLVPGRLLAQILFLPLFLVIPLAALAAIGIGVTGLMVLSLATWMDSPGYNVEMVSLYAFWTIFLASIAMLFPLMRSLAEKMQTTRGS